MLTAADLHLQSLDPGGDRQVLVAQAPHQVEGLLWWLLLCQEQRVLLDVLLDGVPHVRRRAKVPIGRHQPVERVVRPLEVVVLEVKPDAPLAVGKVGEDRARQELVPQGLPEALDLAQRLGMLGPALHVLDAEPPQLLRERGLASPRRVLPALVR